MKEPTATLRVAFNEDDEIIARIDECEHFKAECPNKDCPFAIMIAKRIYDLKCSLKNHMLF